MSEKFDKVLAKANEALNKMKSPIERERDTLKQQLNQAVYESDLRASERDRAEKQLAEAVEVVTSLLKFCDELCEDLRVSKHYPSMDKARAFLQKIGVEK